MTSFRGLRAALMTAVVIPVSLTFCADIAVAQQSDLGTVTVAGAPKPAAAKPKPKPVRTTRAPASRRPTTARRVNAAPVVAAVPTGAPISSDAAIGRNAPAGSAPALAPSQGSLNQSEPGSTVSDKVLRDIIPASSDYNEAAKFTPGFVSSNANGVGDSKSGWRGFQDGQFNITFDGIPFGDANDPSHHSAAYFPGSFLGRVNIDRGPGPASQVGYAPFGGTMSLWSLDLTDKRYASVGTSFGSFNTFTTDISAQSGYIASTQTRALIAFSHIQSDGQLQYGNTSTYQGLIKIEKQFGDAKITALATGGTERYNNTGSPTYPQLLQFGKNYGELNKNPLTQQFTGYNNSLKATDMEYIRFEANVLGFDVDNKVYTYSYWYPKAQNNGSDQTIEGLNSNGNGTVNQIKIPKIPPQTGTTTINVLGTTNGDVTGYLKENNYRAYGDILNISRDIKAGFASGTLRTGVWIEGVDNHRAQPYIDYTTGQTYTQLGNAQNIAYKLNLNSKIRNIQPFAEYEWRPTENLTITPGYKYEAFTRIHDASINQTTLAPIAYSHTYTANLPFLAARYKLNSEWTIYAQASKGFLAPTVSAYYVFNPDTSNQIAPQQTTNYQVGTVYKTGRVTFSADAYQIEATNFPVNIGTKQQPVQVNGGTVRYRGLEAEGTLAIINGFAAYASGALIEAKFTKGLYGLTADPNAPTTSAGLRVGNAPTFTAAGGFIYDDAMFFGSLLYKVTGSSYGSAGQIGPNVLGASLNKVGAYNTTDFVAGLRTNVLRQIGFGDSAEIKFGVQNIFNNRSLTDVSGDPTGLVLNNTKLQYTFQSGRMIYVAAKIGF